MSVKDRMASVAPGRLVPLNFHWYVSGEAPVAVTRNHTGEASAAVWLTGDEVMNGGPSPISASEFDPPAAMAPTPASDAELVCLNLFSPQATTVPSDFSATL